MNAVLQPLQGVTLNVDYSIETVLNISKMDYRNEHHS